MDYTSHTARSPSLIAIQEKQEDEQQLEDAICRNPEVTCCKPPQHRNSPAHCQCHHWTFHGLPALWAPHTHGNYVRSYAPTCVFLEVMGSLDSVQRIKESFERMLLFISCILFRHLTRMSLLFHEVQDMSGVNQLMQWNCTPTLHVTG